MKELDEITRNAFRVRNVSSEDEQVLLCRIAKLLIRFTYKYHKEDRDIIGELCGNSIAINQIIGQKMEKIRMREKGGKP